MSIVSRDRSALQYMIDYCQQIQETVSLFGQDYEIFTANRTYRNACSLCILQIGELTNTLTEDFRAKYTGVPWKSIKGMRNIVAHAYGTVDPEVVWEIIIDDIPLLEKYCIGILNEN